MEKPTIILATSNGVGMGHLARASAIAYSLKEIANPIIVSMAGGIAEVPDFMGIRCEYIPGKDRMWMTRDNWDIYLRDRLLALVDETGARVLSFDGVVPYPGIIGVKNIRPEISLVWVRRGFWQKTPQRFALNLQSKIMDQIVTPGDYGQSYDKGPTANRNDSTLVKPISIYNSKNSMTKLEARKTLGIEPDRPAVLVQLGIGEADANAKLTAALTGLLSWPNLQVVLTKDPVDSQGKNLAPAGLDIKVIRYFPLANVLNAFDAAICAAGYNSVHEELAAKIPTLFVPNIRGTDNQAARAAWAADNKMALSVDQNDLKQIQENSAKLASQTLREELANNCSKLPLANGASDVAQIFEKLHQKPKQDIQQKTTIRIKLKIHDLLGHGWRGTAYSVLQGLTLVYRWVKPHKKIEVLHSSSLNLVESENSDELRNLIKTGNPFEHLILGASQAYKNRRIEIASKAYLK